MQNLSCENEFYLHDNKKAFTQERFCTWPRFKTEACGISEMAYSLFVYRENCVKLPAEVNTQSLVTHGHDVTLLSLICGFEWAFCAYRNTKTTAKRTNMKRSKATTPIRSFSRLESCLVVSSFCGCVVTNNFSDTSVDCTSRYEEITITTLSNCFKRQLNIRT